MDKKLSWEQVADLAQKLAQHIKKSGFVPDYLIGVATGGLIPLGLLAGELHIKNILTVSVSSYTGRQQGELKVGYLPAIDLQGKKLLLIDEVVETGATLSALVKLFKEKYNPSELRTATLVLNKKESCFSPDYYVLEANGWTAFPWEKE